MKAGWFAVVRQPLPPAPRRTRHRLSGPWRAHLNVVGTGIDPVTSRFSGALRPDRPDPATSLSSRQSR